MECLFSKTDLYKLNWYMKLNFILKSYNTIGNVFHCTHFGPIHNKITKAANPLKANS